MHDTPFKYASIRSRRRHGEDLVSGCVQAVQELYFATLYASILYFATLYAFKIGAEVIFRPSQIRLHWGTQRQVMLSASDKLWF